MIPISKNGPDMASVHKFWYFLLVIHSFSLTKSMPSSLSELKVTPSFCCPFKIPDDPTATNEYMYRMGRKTFTSLRMIFRVHICILLWKQLLIMMCCALSKKLRVLYFVK